MKPLKRRLIYLCIAVAGAIGFSDVNSTMAQSISNWGDFNTPSNAPSNVIGKFVNGCLHGADTLPMDGEGFFVVRPDRNRYHGHPDMVDFIKRFGKKVSQKGLPRVPIADIAAPRGGPISGHSSHQTGLDADIWLKLDIPGMPPEKRNDLMSVSMVDLKNWTITENWSDQQAQVIKIAAKDPKVNRIFVHPVIKKQLCDTVEDDRDWLYKVRPWYGHYSHMHVRLSCPADDKSCIDQAPPPKIEGCGWRVKSWFPKPKPKEPSILPIRPKPKPKPKKPRPPMPKSCQAMLKPN